MTPDNQFRLTITKKNPDGPGNQTRIIIADSKAGVGDAVDLHFKDHEGATASATNPITGETITVVNAGNNRVVHKK